MSFLNELNQKQAEYSPYVSAKTMEVAKPYSFQFIAARELSNEEKAKIGIIHPLAYEFTLLEVDSGAEKTWSTGSFDVFNQLKEQEIDEGSFFTLTRTGDVGKGKHFWLLKKTQ